MKLLLALLFILSLVGRRDGACPESCSCYIMFLETDTLEEAQCGDRGLKEVPPANNSSITKLNTSYNPIATLERKSFTGYDSVRVLILKHCRIQQIDRDTFLKLTVLEHVDISNNLLEHIDKETFSGNPSLKSLSLANNYIPSPSSEGALLIGPPSLISLDLSHCEFSKISSETFSNLPNLKILNMSHNKLQTLDLDVMTSLQHLVDVNLTSNQWKCGSSPETIVCWLYSKGRPRFLKCQERDMTWKKWGRKDMFLRCNRSRTHVTQMTSTSVAPTHTNKTELLEPKEVFPQTRAENIQLLWIVLSGCLAVFCFVVLCAVVYILLRLSQRHNCSEPE